MHQRALTLGVAIALIVTAAWIAMALAGKAYMPPSVWMGVGQILFLIFCSWILAYKIIDILDGIREIVSWRVSNK